MTSTLQCKFEGYAHDVVWYYETLLFLLRIEAVTSLAVGNQYRQSIIQMSSEDIFYINKLIITDRNASFGPYYCVVFMDSHNSRSLSIRSTYLSTSKSTLQLANVVRLLLS